MRRGKERADLRTGELKRLLVELENHRDNLLDAVSKKKGEAEATERIIKRTYELILDVNNDELTHAKKGKIK